MKLSLKERAKNIFLDDAKDLPIQESMPPWMLITESVYLFSQHGVIFRLDAEVIE